MATRKNTKLRLPQGKVLRFTPTGKAISISAQMMADEQLLQAYFPSCPEFSSEPVRSVALAWLRNNEAHRSPVA
jgi:hypothetical protein